MASSRWKRFAFFDRKNLSLPPSVVKDLIPSNNKSSSSSSARGSSSTINNDDNLDPNFLYQDDGEPTTSEDNAKLGSGEYFSFVAASNVSLPSSSSLGAAEGIGAEDGDAAVAVTRRGAGGDGAPGMQAGLVALRNATTASASRGHDHGSKGGSSNPMTVVNGGRGGGGDGELLLMFASSRNTSLVHCIDVTVRCTPSNPRYSATAAQQHHTDSAALSGGLGGGVLESSTSNEGYNAFASAGSNEQQRGSNNNANANANANNNMSSSDAAAAASSSSTTNPEELDGWRGHYNPFYSCDGFASGGRKDVNLLGGGGGGSVLSSSKLPPKPTTAASSKGGARRKTAAERILDEHTGGDEYDSTSAGGGSLFGASPFAGDFPIEATSSAVPKARIVGLATCSHSSSFSSKATAKKSSSSSSVLYVAAITDTPDTIGVVVHANPHLMLSSLPPNASKTTMNSENLHSSYYLKPSTAGAFNFVSHGKPRSVSILPGVLCIGTDAGAVLIYVFKLCNGNDTNTGGSRLMLVAEIPAPRANVVNAADGASNKLYSVSSVKLVGPALEESDAQQPLANGGNHNNNIHRLFVSYRRRQVQSSSSGVAAGNGNVKGAAPSSPTNTASGPSGGVCCYDLGGLRIPGFSLATGLSANAPVVSARYDMDGRDVGTSCLCDEISLPPAPPSVWTSKDDGDGITTGDANNNNNSMEKMLPRFTVARGDGLHLYSPEEKVGVCPIDGNKLAICSLPPPPAVYLRRPVRPPSVDGGGGGAAGTAAASSGGDNGTVNGAGASYALVATTDSKSGRDAVDVYDTTNKLVGFHVLLSPGHRALRTAGIVSPPTVGSGALLRGGRSSAVVLTSGGSIVTLTEKVTPDKVDLLTQKNLYAAAISMAFSDPQFYRPEDITALYRRYAEHLYRKGDFAAAMDQYVLTIGSLESSHVIFRYLDAPKIPLAVKYLEALRSAGLASGVHDELLRTCYLKLGDMDAASKIVLASSASDATCEAPLNPDGSEVPTVPISRNLLACADDPSEMLAAICSLEAPAAAEALVAHGVLIARSLPRESAGVVIALCDGSYSPTAMADAAAGRPAASRNDRESNSKCEKYPISLFANAFMENPKLFRLILSHCRRNDCVLTPMLRRTLLELTLDEWNAAKRTGDIQVEKLRHDEALVMLSENHVDDMGDYEALVIVQAAGFTEGEILLYERLNMVPMLLEEYAKSGTARARRQMLAMCEHGDPDLFAEVLAHFVSMARERLNKGSLKDEVSVDSESGIGSLLHDIHEALVMARDEYGGDLPPVRLLRILAGEGHGMFSSDNHHNGNNHQSLNHNNDCGVPLSAAIDYVGVLLDGSERQIHRLKNNVEEYTQLCNDMELEIISLLSPGSSGKYSDDGKKNALPNVDIDEMYSNLCQLEEEEGISSAQYSTTANSGIEMMREDFWREMEQHSDDPFETICFYISKGYLENI